MVRPSTELLLPEESSCKMSTSSSSSFLREENFRCVICLSVFTDPATLPCGHNFCKGCIVRYWDACEPTCRCPLCVRVFPERPELSVNSMLSGLCGGFREHQLKEERDREIRAKADKAKIQRKIRKRRTRIEVVRRIADVHRRETDKVLSIAARAYAMRLISVSHVESSLAAITDNIKEQQNAAAVGVEGLVRSTERKIAQLERKMSSA